MLASESHALSPWTMGLPFVIGQLLMAAILHFASGRFPMPKTDAGRRPVLLRRT